MSAADTEAGLSLAPPKTAMTEIILAAFAGCVTGVASLHNGADAGQASLALIFGAGLSAIATTDFRRYIIPDHLVAMLLASGLAHAALRGDGLDRSALALAALASCAAAALLFMVREAYRHAAFREGLGLGDVKLAAAAGAWLPLPQLGLSIALAALIAILSNIYCTMMRKRVRKRVPLGAYWAPTILIIWLSAQLLRVDLL